MKNRNETEGRELAEAAPETEMPEIDPVFDRGMCPCCGGRIYSDMQHVPGEGYFIAWVCWARFNGRSKCPYRIVK